MLLGIKGRERGEERGENTIKRDKRETVTEYRMKGGKERKKDTRNGLSECKISGIRVVKESKNKKFSS